MFSLFLIINNSDKHIFLPSLPYPKGKQIALLAWVDTHTNTTLHMHTHTHTHHTHTHTHTNTTPHRHTQIQTPHHTHTHTQTQTHTPFQKEQFGSFIYLTFPYDLFEASDEDTENHYFFPNLSRF